MNIILLGLMILVGGFSKIYRRFIPLSLGIEFKTFFIIITAYYVDLNTAILCAVLMVIISAVVVGRFCHWILIKIMVYTLVCMIIGLFHGLGVQTSGRIAIIFLNVAYLFFNALFKDFRIMADLPGNIVNIILNFAMLAFLAEPLGNLLA
jgi:hypothetical protein